MNVAAILADLNVSNSTLLTWALVIAIILGVLLIVGWVMGRWRP